MPNKPLALKKLEAEDADDLDDKYKEMSVEEIKTQMLSFPTTKLADIIIANRYLGLYKDLAVTAMEELSKRRMSGDNFQYEQYIEDELKKLPKLDFTLPALGSLFDKIGSFKL